MHEKLTAGLLSLHEKGLWSHSSSPPVSKPVSEEKTYMQTKSFLTLVIICNSR